MLKQFFQHKKAEIRRGIYESVNGEEVSSENLEEIKNDASPPKNTKVRRCLQIVALTTSLLIFLVGGILYLVSWNKVNWHGCGSSPADAREHGCRYDLLMGAWLPAECYDGALLEEWIEGEEGKWYQDKNFTTLLPWEEVRSGNCPLAYTRPDFHWRHCSYVWTRLLRNLKDHRSLDEDTLSIHHTKHCTDLTADPEGHSVRLGKWSAIKPKFSICAKPGWKGWGSLVI